MTARSWLARTTLVASLMSVGLVVVPNVASADPPPVRVIETLRDPDDAGGAEVSFDSEGGDCGWSVPLHDGNTLWVVCDPLHLGPTAPRNTADIVDPAHEREPTFGTVPFVPHPVAAAPGSAPSCTATWVSGVVASPAASTTDVLATFRSSCKGSPSEPALEHSGVAWYQYGGTYNANNTPEGIQATVLNTQMWPEVWPDGTPNNSYGNGAVLHDGYIYSYSCRRGSATTVESGGCKVGRFEVGSGTPGDLALWSYWDRPTDSWIAPSCASTCTLTEIEDAEEEADLVDFPVPDGLPRPNSVYQPHGHRVWFDERFDLFVSMTQRSLDPAWELCTEEQLDDDGRCPTVDDTDRVWIRVAEQPEGPWSLPAEVRLDCAPSLLPSSNPFVGLECYHQGPHPEMSTGTDIVFTYFDQLRGGDDQHFAAARLCVEGQAAAFSDVSTSHQFHAEIADRADACVLGGFQDGTFHPTEGISRQGFLTMLWRQEGFEPWAHPPPTYTSDVPIAPPFHDQVSWADANGYTTTFPEVVSQDKLKPTSTVTRAEAVELLYRAACEPPGPYTEPFNDVNSSTPNRDAIAWAVSNGIASSASTFIPGNPVSRQAAAAFFMRAAAPGVDDAC